MMVKLFFILLNLIFPYAVQAYPQFIGHSYTSCMNCHFNPFGGGQLTDYGRVVSANLISSDVFYPKDWNEEKVAYTSGFLFRKPKQDWIRLQANYRGFNIVRNPGGNEQRQWITMQLDARVALKFGENDKFLFVGDYGRIPELQNPPPGIEPEKKYRSRNLYVGYRPNQKYGLYAGLMDKVYGIRVVEHIAFSRINPQITQNDQVYGVASHYLSEPWEGGVHAFLGNPYQDEEHRQKGFSTWWERTFHGHRIGASFLTSQSDFLELNSLSVHGRFNIKDGSALLAEVGQTNRSSNDNSPSPTSRFALLQTVVRPYRGFYLLTNIDYQKNDISEDNHILRWGPAVQYFPVQRIELRGDIYNTRNFLEDATTRDSWMYLLQLHLWI